LQRAGDPKINQNSVIAALTRSKRTLKTLTINDRIQFFFFLATLKPILLHEDDIIRIPDKAFTGK